MHTIVWRNKNDLDTISLDDLYNHLIVYEAEVQTKSNSNSQNMTFISSSKNSSRNEDGFDKSKVKCFNCQKMGHFVRECRAPRSQERGRKESYRQGSKTEEKTPKALMAIDGVG
nr:retrotransposon protein, putative, Ty1-copia subclass, expressed [Tanacetum cinerariifolium]